jgi:mRNA interferase RelE/StbE
VASLPHHIEITEEAANPFASIHDRSVCRQIAARIDQFATAPDEMGKPLHGPLEGLWSTRAAAQRYRIIYTIDDELMLVAVVLVGKRREGDRRRDVYEIARRRFGRGRGQN